MKSEDRTKLEEVIQLIEHQLTEDLSPKDLKELQLKVDILEKFSRLPIANDDHDHDNGGDHNHSHSSPFPTKIFEEQFKHKG